MATPAPLNPKVPTSDLSAEPPAPIVPSFEERLRLFWEKNSKTVYALCVVVLLAIVGRGVLDYYQRQKEEGTEADYTAATTPEKLKTFINQHPDHPLAAVASLTQGDEAYSAKNYAEALSNYQRASEILKSGPFAGRARLGIAIAKVNLGQTADGEDKLKQIANDSTQLKPVRAEAAYHLATLAVEAGRLDEATKFLELTSTIEPNGSWAQRAMMLRTSLPVSTNSAVAPLSTTNAPAKPAATP